MDRQAITQNLDQIRDQIARATAHCGRAAESVSLVAVAKTHGWDAVETAFAAGQFRFGENRVQESIGKYPPRTERDPRMVLHLIGSLQSNKARQAAQFFDVIESLDRDSLAQELAKLRDSGLKLPKLLIQVNTGAEPQKSGVLGKDADEFITRCIDLWNLPIAGLMCVPPLGEPPEPHFAMLAAIAKKFKHPELSMGMSHDFEAAIRLGATSVRVGSAIFGNRSRGLSDE